MKKDYIKLSDFRVFSKEYGKDESPRYTQKRDLSLEVHIPGHTGKVWRRFTGEAAITFTVWSDVNPHFRSLAITQTHGLMSY